MADKILHFRELRVYQTSFETAMEIAELVTRFPADERFCLVDQMRRASRSVCSGIAEAWRRRRYEAAWINKLNESETEACEMQVHLQFALRSGYIRQETFARLDDVYDHVLGQLVLMIEHPTKWVLPSSGTIQSPRRPVAQSPRLPRRVPAREV